MNQICPFYFNVVLFGQICDGPLNPNTRVWVSQVSTLLNVELNINVDFIPHYTNRLPFKPNRD